MMALNLRTPTFAGKNIFRCCLVAHEHQVPQQPTILKGTAPIFIALGFHKPLTPEPNKQKENKGTRLGNLEYVEEPLSCQGLRFASV